MAEAAAMTEEVVEEEMEVGEEAQVEAVAVAAPWTPTIPTTPTRIPTAMA